ncbi:hypothetical protein M6B38_168960 [Iris pallida]|uniref:Uncharacterized protein n=1 Tax=Iris pallida TaxID=29817 RepID=A0AAX6EVS6_IRIPA|nr:hypothetical protein M6B38_168960 [Iris pallida]
MRLSTSPTRSSPAMVTSRDLHDGATVSQATDRRLRRPCRLPKRLNEPSLVETAMTTMLPSPVLRHFDGESHDNSSIGAPLFSGRCSLSSAVASS